MKFNVFSLAFFALFTSSVAGAADAPPAFNQCKACHKTASGKHGVGPSLFRVYNTKAGHAEGYKRYSANLLNSGLTWDEANLSKFLMDPKGTVPGNKMTFHGIKKLEDVKALIDYLKTLQ